MTSTHPKALLPDDEQLVAAAEMLKLLADKTRLHLVAALCTAPADVTALTEITGASRTSVSQHLAKLRLAGVVRTERDTRRIVYSVTDDHLARLVAEILSHADHVTSGEPLHRTAQLHPASPAGASSRGSAGDGA